MNISSFEQIAQYAGYVLAAITVGYFMYVIQKTNKDLEEFLKKD
ncbi:hypothetical protein tpqmel_0653 [Candidatus Gastranaerophilus sp. (ex Termes propinquus)]|nr:hypothetical protein tpqmel_0653 [Candidatus Gastranaerophilus sp. (ex Termes propinquus)]